MASNNNSSSSSSVPISTASTGTTNTAPAEVMPSFHEVRNYYLEYLEKSGQTQGNVATTLHITPTIISLWRHGHATDREDVTWKVWRWSHGKYNPDEPVPAPYALHGPQGLPRVTKINSSPKGETTMNKLSVATRTSRMTSSALDSTTLTIPGLASVNTVRQSMRSRAKTANGYVRANYVMDQIHQYNHQNNKKNNIRSLMDTTNTTVTPTLNNPLSLNPLLLSSPSSSTITTLLHPTVPLVRRSLNGQPTIDESAISALPLTGLSIRGNTTTGDNGNHNSLGITSSTSTTTTHTNGLSPNLPPDAAHTGLLPIEEILEIRIVRTGNSNTSVSTTPSTEPKPFSTTPNGSPSLSKVSSSIPVTATDSWSTSLSLPVSSYECLVRWTADMSMEEVAMQNSIELTMSKVMNQSNNNNNNNNSSQNSLSSSSLSSSTGSSLTSSSPTVASPLSPTTTQQLYEQLQNIGLAMWIPLEHIFGPILLRRYYSNQNMSSTNSVTLTTPSTTTATKSTSSSSSIPVPVPTVIEEIIHKQDSFSFGEESEDEPDTSVSPFVPSGMAVRGGRGRGRGRGRGSRGGKLIHPWIRMYMQQPLTPLIAAMCTLLPELISNDNTSSTLVHGIEPTNGSSLSRKRRNRDGEGEDGGMSITAFPVPTETAFDWEEAFKKLNTTLKGVELLNEIQAKENELYRTANNTMTGASMSVIASPFSSPMTVGRSMEAKDTTSRMQLPLHWDIVSTPAYLTTEEQYKIQESKLPTVEILQAYRPGKKRRGRGGFGAAKFRGMSRGRGGRGRGGGSALNHNVAIPTGNTLGFDNFDVPDTMITGTVATDPTTTTSSNPSSGQFAGWPDLPRGLVTNLEKTLTANERIEQQYTKLLSSEDNSLLRIGGNISSANNSVLEEDTVNHGNPKLLSIAQWLLRDYGHVLPIRPVLPTMILNSSSSSVSSSSSFTSGMSVVGPYSVLSDTGTPVSISSAIARYDPVHQTYPSQLPDAHKGIPGWNDYRLTKYINLENVPDYCIGLEAPTVRAYQPLEGTQEPVFSILVRGADDVIAVPCTRLTPEEYQLRTDQRIILRKHLDFLREKGGYRKVLVSDNTVGTTATSSNVPSSSASTQEGAEEDLYIADEENENMEEEILDTVNEGTEEKKTTVVPTDNTTNSIASLTASSLVFYSDSFRGGRGRGRGKRGGGLHGRGGYRRYPPITGPIYAWIRDKNFMMEGDTIGNGSSSSTVISHDAAPVTASRGGFRGGVRGGRGGHWGRGGFSNASGVSLKSISVMDYLRKTGFANVLMKVGTKETNDATTNTGSVTGDNHSIDLSSPNTVSTDTINVAILPPPELGFHPRDIDWSTELDVDFDELLSGSKRGRLAMDVSAVRKDDDEADIENEGEEEAEDEGDEGEEDDDELGGADTEDGDKGDTSRLPYSSSRTKGGLKEIGTLGSTFGRVVRLPVLSKFQRPGKIVIMKQGEPMDGQPLPYQFYYDSEDDYQRHIAQQE